MSALDTEIAAPRERRSILIEAVYAATLGLSAALFFSLEPMFSKMVLPVLGGSSSVWSVAMVVFQGLLLAGYVYADLLTRWCTLRTATLIHAIVLALATLALPIAIASGFRSQPPEHFVSLWLIGLFLASVGLPSFALAANAPLLQAWFARSGHRNADNPYMLYRASNAGSFAVLLAYPFLIEPAFGLAEQSRLWSLFFWFLLASICACGFWVSRSSTLPLREGQKAGASATAFQCGVTWKQRALWIALGFIPSGLLVAVTAHISTDVASGPFLWVLPLALYLLTFVLAFADRPLLSTRLMLALQPASLALLATLLLWANRAWFGVALIGNLSAFFVAAMVCQARLYRTRPAASDLTEFYALMSLGGVLGGIFAGLLAPAIFHAVYEYPLLAFAALLAREDILRLPSTEWKKETAMVAGLVAVLVAVGAALSLPLAYFIICIMALAAVLAVSATRPARAVLLAAALLVATSVYDPSQSLVTEARSFYGVYKIVDVENGKFRVLYHGTTAHGAERLDRLGDAGGKPDPLTYYYHGGSFGLALNAVRARKGGRFNHVALVGLGVGALTCYAKPGEHWTIYELDPLIVRIAGNPHLFRTLSSCAVGMPIVLGDGRLTLKHARAPLDLLLLDIFSSDSVPTHMLTAEAFQLFKSKLAPHGVIAFNISNHNMELASVVAGSAAANGMVTAIRTDPPPPTDTLKLRTEVAVVAHSKADLDALRLGPGWLFIRSNPSVRIWTDDYSDILGAVLRKAALEKH